MKKNGYYILTIIMGIFVFCLGFCLICGSPCPHEKVQETGIITNASYYITNGGTIHYNVAFVNDKNEKYFYDFYTRSDFEIKNFVNKKVTLSQCHKCEKIFGVMEEINEE